MTKEERREYMKEWRKANKDKIRESQRNRARMKALADLESVRQLDSNIFIFKAHNEREYIVGGWKH